MKEIHMKKSIITLLTLSIVSVGYSQFTKGTILIGGNTNLGFGSQTETVKAGSTSSTISKLTTVAFQPQAGYFLMDNLAIGAGINIYSGTTKWNASTDKYTVSQLIFAPFGRYYFNKIFAQASFGLGSKKEKDTQAATTTTIKTSVSNWSIAGGYAVLLNESIALEPQLGYGSTTDKSINNGTTVKDIYSGIFIRLGVSVYFSRK